MEARKVVIPVAGWGTRSLPATKNVPKEMLPIYKKPAVQHVVEEAIEADLTNVVFVTNQQKRILEDHFDYNLSLEAVLRRTKREHLLREVRQVAEMANIISVRQKEQLGLGHAVLCAREVVFKEPFAVMVGDDLMFSRRPAIKQLLEAAKTEHMSVVGVVEVSRENVSNYGIIQGEEIAPGLYRIRNVYEKPRVEDAPSRLAIVGRYVLTPEIFEHLETLEPGHNLEYQLSDALQSMARHKRVLAVKLEGQRYDIGNWVDYLSANIHFALQDDELKTDLLKSLEDFLPGRK
ncbi:UTP--glucose-1-phosphate uridylyltransferase GalU [Desulfonatronospira sp.]|uniref:UTP--glucose-1-phosphate uridylyltransferase GalU n=1 Tax=Desulfonatronospira sp. TaxID=1962951 RepID=UPI0025BB4F22|nr:UTP--glucose-1-phosphate uridylyltransferase GalU [Desulfonatronospira sp.]